MKEVFKPTNLQKLEAHHIGHIGKHQGGPEAERNIGGKSILLFLFCLQGKQSKTCLRLSSLNNFTSFWCEEAVSRRLVS